MQSSRLNTPVLNFRTISANNDAVVRLSVTHSNLDHLQDGGNIAPSSIRVLIHFHAGALISNLEANSAPGLQLIKDRLSQLSEEP